MKLTFYGAAQTVTGSQHLVEINGKRILLDCGLYQGSRKSSYERNRHLPYDAKLIDALVLSHAHIDHSGNIPNLVKSGFEGDIFCTYATRDLCAAMLMDSGHIQERDAEYMNRKRKKNGDTLIEPIYTQEDAFEALNSFAPMGINRSRPLVNGVKVTLRDVGHILGAACVQLNMENEETGQLEKLVYSGDIGRPGIPILKDPVTPPEADVLIMESTYGGREHDPYPDMEKQLRDVILSTVERGGNVIVPAFAVGRTQHLVYILNKLFHEGEIPDIPIFVDSPLAVNVTDIFRLHPEIYDKEARDYMFNEDPDGNLFGFPMLTYVRHVERSKMLNSLDQPVVIISASGMAVAGRILHHLKHNISDRRSTVLITGFQAAHTLGRRIVERDPVVKIFGESYEVKAKIVELTGFSGHADHKGLIEWVSKFEKKPKTVFLVHGEGASQEALAAGIKTELGIEDVRIPGQGQSFTL